MAVKPNCVPVYHLYGNRKLNIIHTKLRYSVSKLNYDLFRFNLCDSPSCVCGNPCENVHHYLLNCHLYNNPRLSLLENTRVIVNNKVKIDLLLINCFYLTMRIYQKMKIKIYLKSYIHISRKANDLNYRIVIRFSILFLYLSSLFYIM